LGISAEYARHLNSAPHPAFLARPVSAHAPERQMMPLLRPFDGDFPVARALLYDLPQQKDLKKKEIIGGVIQ
jgi:hypothetical protein